MKLVKNAKDAHKMWTVWLFTALTVVSLIDGYWGYFSALVPEQYHSLAMAAFGVAGIALRLIKQGNIRD